ncbi:hypothetical protein BZA77DRAFT_347136 [Pyronema omphalodes]|nr:hypothetical protein BZA77DRAFT_347136 [Pyronema omphalodes]
MSNNYISRNRRPRTMHLQGTTLSEQPNDEAERDRLVQYHKNNVLILRPARANKLHYAAFNLSHRIIDIGNGTEILAIDMTDKYGAPYLKAEVICTDLSPIQQG